MWMRTPLKHFVESQLGDTTTSQSVKKKHVLCRVYLNSQWRFQIFSSTKASPLTSPTIKRKKSSEDTQVVYEIKVPARVNSQELEKYFDLKASSDLTFTKTGGKYFVTSKSGAAPQLRVQGTVLETKKVETKSVFPGTHGRFFVLSVPEWINEKQLEEAVAPTGRVEKVYLSRKLKIAQITMESRLCAKVLDKTVLDVPTDGYDWSYNYSRAKEKYQAYSVKVTNLYCLRKSN